MQVTETHEQKRDRVLAAWQQAKNMLDYYKEAEMTLRKEAFPLVFGDNARVGTNRVELGNGWGAKGVRKISYKLDQTLEKAQAVYQGICNLGNEGPFLAQRLLKWSMDLGEGEYKKLDPAMPTHKAAKDLIDSILTTSDGAPTLELVPPK